MDETSQNCTPEKDQWPTWSKAFLTSLALSGVIGKACEAAEISRSQVYNFRRANKEFRKAWKVALNTAIDNAESEAWRRATKGCQRPVYQGKELVGYITDYSDTLLIFMLKAHRPKKYRDNHRIEHTGKGGGPIDVVTVVETIYSEQPNGQPAAITDARYADHAVQDGPAADRAVPE